MDNYIYNAAIWLQMHASAESLTILSFLFCSGVILVLLRSYGAMGLYVYNALAIIVANIQVLRFTVYNTYDGPVALGTVLFTTTFLVNDLLSEHYGKEAASKCVSLGFWVQIVMVVWMVLTLGHPLVPLSGEPSPALLEAQISYEAMVQLFTPSLRMLMASLIAYWFSQWLDVFIFSKLRTMTGGRHVWLRQNASMIISGFIDTALFSILAWRWFSHTPVSWMDLWMTFILSAQFIRILLNLAATPLMYLSFRCLEPSYRKISSSASTITSSASSKG